MSVDNAHRGTPSLAVSGPRGLAVRTIQYHRRQAADPLETRVTHQRFDVAARPVASRDPYLFALAQNDASVPANLSQVFSLSGAPLSSDSVDAGWRLVFHGVAGQGVEAWDGRGSHSLTEFDELLRPVAVYEDGEDFAKRVLERFTYAGVDADAASRNLCGQLMRHDDPAGTLHLRELGIAGAALQQTRHFLLETGPVNWPDSVAARDALLEPGAGATTSHTYAPTTELLQQIDALGNRQSLAYSVAGELKNSRLTLAGDDPHEMPLVSELHYNASGQIEAETAGNGVITRHHFDPADARLIGLSAHKANGTPLQDLKYRYDAAGNVLSLEDATQPIRYFNNQRIEPIKTYRYDTLDQLIEATGWEAKTGSALPELQPLPLAPNQIANYTQTFHYDAGGNLLDLTHVGAQTHSRTLTRAQYSNRCLPEHNGRPPTEAELAGGFDANGNLRELQAGQSLGWDWRNQLSTLRPVVREVGEDDYERYAYDGGGQRVRKLRSSQTNARTLVSEVRYLPGLEIRRHDGTGEILHVINASAGSNSVQMLHWVAKQPEDIDNDQARYSLNDHLQSSALELDQNADLISQEWYYPFGGTACFAARSATEAKYKTVRYSGKERDSTGLYYYGFRYYAPWLQRWINPDPAGYVDGINLYQFVGSDPVNNVDSVGLDKKRWQMLVHKHLLPGHGHVLRGRHLDYIGEQINDRDRQLKNSSKYKGIRYYNQQERADNLMTLTVNNGLLFNNKQQLIGYNATTTSSSNWLKLNANLGYALGFNEQHQSELSIFKHTRDKRYHSSPFSGRPVLDAGMIVITNGAVSFIENKSGHYRPKIEQKLHTLNFLKKGGANLKDIFVSERIPDELKAEPHMHQEELETYFENNLYNASDLYEWNIHIEERHAQLPSSHVNTRPTVNIPSKGKSGLSPLETLTFRDWAQRDKNGRPGKLLKSSRLLVNKS